MTFNIAGQVGQMKLSANKALWPIFETIVNSIQSLEDSERENKEIIIEALRDEQFQLKFNEKDKTSFEPTRFKSFIITDNGFGFNDDNYNSFQEAYTQLKIAKGCKGIGRFLWLKTFERITIDSIYFENGNWYQRSFAFNQLGVEPDDNKKLLSINDKDYKTTVSLEGFKNPYCENVSYSLDSLAKKVIEHCLPYFILGNCPKIVLKDNYNEVINLNDYYEKFYKEALKKDTFEISGKNFELYNMRLSEGVEKNILHLCANNREVKSVALSKYIPDMEKRLNDGEKSYYYIGYLTGEYLNNSVNLERSDFNFSEAPLLDSISETEMIEKVVESVNNYLQDDLEKIADEKKIQIDTLVKTKHPQYRLLLDRFPEIYGKIPAGLAEDKLEIELYKNQQKWELEIAEKKNKIEEKVKNNITTDSEFKILFDEYCENITELSRASLSEYVIHRKAVLDLFERALQLDEDANYSKEAHIHGIICPMRTTSDEIKYDDMNLWLIDERLAYHHFLASDKKMSDISVLENNSEKRMDLAIFDAALSYSADPDNISSITIIELKRPQRNDYTNDENDPITQVYDYVTNIKEGRVKRKNGRNFGNLQNIAFYCYIIADITPTLEKRAKNFNLIQTQDKEGYFGYNAAVGTYIEIISYDKLLKDAKQRNKVLFDKLFNPKAVELKHPKNII